jgi:hypothetical protein
MNNNPFERSLKTTWTLIAIVMFVPVAFIFVMVKFTIGGTSAILIPAYVCIFLVFAFMCSAPVIQLMTKYTDSGIEQPSFWGSKFLHWQDVQEIRNITTSEIILVGSDAKISANLILFKNPQGFLSEIRLRIPESAYPSENKINLEIYRRKQNDSGRSIIGALLSIILIIIVGKNIYAVIFGLLMVAFMIYEIRNWLRYRNLQSLTPPNKDTT